ncbi:hypothetical protein VT03_23465 [Planctomyces sp. SH-PL14]|nr:hypothetical protein VT03_23465 [Planctomyces sp. SH-PL14]
MLSFCRMPVAVALLTVPFLVSGCGKKRDPRLPQTVGVTGNVIYRDVPLEKGTITFHPQGGKGNPADGRLVEGGSFSLSTYSTGDGAVLGQHKVTIQLPPRLDGEPAGPMDTVPVEYTSVEETPLSAEVTEGGKNHFEFKVVVEKKKKK